VLIKACMILCVCEVNAREKEVNLACNVVCDRSPSAHEYTPHYVHTLHNPAVYLFAFDFAFSNLFLFHSSTAVDGCARE
jgi:hypothetical protein